MSAQPRQTPPKPWKLLAALAASLAIAPAAKASPPPLSVPISSDDSGGDGSRVSTGLLGNLQRTNFLLGNMFGLRSALSPYGVSIAIQETSEAVGNVTGGLRRGAAYEGLTQAVLQLDTSRAFGLYGGLLNISALQIHGRNFSADNLANLQTVSGIEADRATRLWELWYDQKFLEDDRLDIKVGQQSVDQEFIVNTNGAYFVNTMFGWPTVPSYDLPGGGPAYPLSSPGIRFRYRPINPVNILLGVFSGSPSDTSNDDAQRANASGTSFYTGRGPLVFLEFQYVYPALGGMMMPDEGAPLGREYRLGAWFDNENFSDQNLDSTRNSLASPDSTGLPLQHHGNYSIYAVADQMVWQDSHFPNRSVSVFGRAMGTPQGDRNLVDYSFNGGIVYHDPVPNRPDDTLGLGFGYAHVSHRAQAYDRAAALYNLTASPGTYAATRSSESFVELTYQYQFYAWWQLQPDAQYIFRPGGGATNPDTGARIKNETVLLLRTNILF